MPSYAVTIEVERERAEDLSAELLEEGAGGVELRDGEELPMPGVAQPPPGRALLVAWFADRGAADEVAAARGGAVEEVADQDWGEAWKKDIAPLTVGRVHVRPSWIATPAPAGTVEIVLDPGMAFGTGSHPTTSLCLRALSDLLAVRPGARVLDVGTGSGLLAIAAAKLGAAHVAGNDNDPVAVKVAAENAAANGVSVALTGADVPRVPGGPFDVVVANILANTLVALAPALAGQLAPGGVVLLSGILVPQEEEVQAAYLAQGLAPLPGAREGEWSLLAFAQVCR